MNSLVKVTATLKVRSLLRALPCLSTIAFAIFVVVQECRIYGFMQRLKPEEFLHNETVIAEWRKHVVGGPWDIKHQMSGPVCVFLLGPLAHFTMDWFPFAKLPFISANVISLAHVVVSLASAKLLISPKLGRRRVGAAFYFVRQYLDELDGMVARFWFARGTPPSGRWGFWFDGLSDTVCVLVLVVAFFVLNHRPNCGGGSGGGGGDECRRDELASPKCWWCRCCRICRRSGVGSVGNEVKHNGVALKDDSDSRLLSDLESGAEDNSHNNSPRSSSPSSSSTSSPPSSKIRNHGNHKLVPAMLFDRESAMIAGTVAAICLSVFIWNNACYLYMDYLDKDPGCLVKRRVQLRLLNSWLSFVVFHGWQLCMPLTLILMCAAAIALDESLRFCEFVARRYVWFVVALSIVTITHLSEISDVLNGVVCR